jgi:hypothetical protein
LAGRPGVMSLDVYIIGHTEKHTQWQTRREASLTEAGDMKGLIPLIEQYYTDREPHKTEELYWANITHNLGRMAEAAGIYQHLWRPEELGIKKAFELIEPLTEGLNKLRGNPEYYKTFNPSNGWGNYDSFVDWVGRYLVACKDNPDGNIEVSR